MLHYYFKVYWRIFTERVLDGEKISGGIRIIDHIPWCDAAKIFRYKLGKTLY